MNLRREIIRLYSKYGRQIIIRKYLATHKIRKLQLGAGPTIHAGWLRTDIKPAKNRIFLDATKRFPLESDTFDYIHSEHMIEHISWQKGLFMLKECHRVLKQNGVVRVATPNLESIIGLYNQKDDPLGARYIQWITDRHISGVEIYKASFVINNAFRNYGHQFLYDGDLLELALKESGFINVHRCAMGESKDDNLMGIEDHGKNTGNEELVAFETMVYEGTCQK